MSHEPERVEFLLLDLHLQQLEPDQADRVREAIDGLPDVADKNSRLTEVLSLLDQYPDPPVRPNLVESVLSRVEEQMAVYPFEKTTSAVSAGSSQDMGVSPVLSLRELIAIAACITLFVGIFVPGYYKAQSIALRNRCLDNLRQVWGGTSEYAEANNGYLAHVGYTPGGWWLPTRVPNVQRASNTAYMYRLVKEGYLRDTMVFICPAVSGARPMRADNYRDFDDFAEPANTSYSFLYNNVAHPQRLEKLDAASNGRMALAGDHNPLFDSNASVRLDPYNEGNANSCVHDNGAGQNVVYINGWAGWFTQPTVGVDHDNIYRAGRRLRHVGNETPIGPTDTLLVP